MKKFILICSAIIFAVKSFGQITITSTAEKKVSAKTYDVSKNFLGSAEEDVMSYVGQELFLKPKSESSQKDGYSDFKVDTFKDSDSRYNRNLTFLPSSSNKSLSSYEELAGKIFVVDSITTSDKTEYKLFATYFFHLHQKDNSRKCVFLYNGKEEYKWPFVVMSYFNNLKSKYVGNSYIIANKELYNIDINTGDSIKFNSYYGQWKCTDLTIENKFCNLVLLFSDGVQTTYKTVDYISEYSKIFETSKWDYLINKYGVESMESVMRGAIKVGMSVDLLYLSWGKPDKINSSSYGENQYVYKNQYVYVKNGIITAWN